MRIFNLGSLNYDKVYGLSHFVQAEETQLCTQFGEFLGGKGLNQSLALAKAGADVLHAGAVGPDGDGLLSCLRQNGVETQWIQRVDTVTGHAIIQSCGGQNCIIVYSGANGCITEGYVDRIMTQAEPQDMLLVQNETSCVPYAITQAKAAGLRVAFNVSPITDAVLEYPLQLVDYFFVNEIEGRAIAGLAAGDAPQILDALSARFPKAVIVLTLGEEGAMYRDSEQICFHPAFCVPVEDTTAAGDTFTGFFLAAILQEQPPRQALRQASAASALAVEQKGAANSIPTRAQMLEFLREQRSK